MKRKQAQSAIPEPILSTKTAADVNDIFSGVNKKNRSKNASDKMSNLIRDSGIESIERSTLIPTSLALPFYSECKNTEAGDKRRSESYFASDRTPWENTKIRYDSLSEPKIPDLFKAAEIDSGELEGLIEEIEFELENDEEVKAILDPNYKPKNISSFGDDGSILKKNLPIKLRKKTALLGRIDFNKSKAEDLETASRKEDTKSRNKNDKYSGTLHHGGAEDGGKSSPDSKKAAQKGHKHLGKKAEAEKRKREEEERKRAEKEEKRQKLKKIKEIRLAKAIAKRTRKRELLPFTRENRFIYVKKTILFEFEENVSSLVKNAIVPEKSEKNNNNNIMASAALSSAGSAMSAASLASVNNNNDPLTDDNTYSSDANNWFLKRQVYTKRLTDLCNGEFNDFGAEPSCFREIEDIKKTQKAINIEMRKKLREESKMTGLNLFAGSMNMGNIQFGGQFGNAMKNGLNEEDLTRFF